MAGIGWRLERLIGRGTLSGVAAAYATGAAVMALPWALTTAVLVALPAILGRGTADLGTVETVVTVAYSVALLVDGPLQIVVARHTADRLYEGRLGAIAAPLFRGLGTVCLLSVCLASAVLVALGLPPAAVLSGAALAAIAGTQWTALSVGNGLCSPAVVLGAVGGGAVLSLVLAPLLVLGLGLGVEGCLISLIAGQALALAALLVAILRALPEDGDEDAALWPAVREYASLAGAGFAFNASLWIDKLLTWTLARGEVPSYHAAASTLAWFSTIPCLAWIFVEVETTFHRRFRAFYAALEGGASLAELRRGLSVLGAEARRLLVGAAVLQAGLTLVLEVGAGMGSARLGLPDGALLAYRFLLLGTGVQALALLGLILLYYFDRRRDALIGAGSLFAGIGCGTALAIATGLPPSVGMAAGCTAGTTVLWWRVARGVQALLRHTLLGQPFGSERLTPLPARPTVTRRAGPRPLSAPEPATPLRAARGSRSGDRPFPPAA